MLGPLSRFSCNKEGSNDTRVTNNAFLRFGVPNHEKD
jgi:hypothetical protein